MNTHTDPQQELFTAIQLDIKAKGHSVHDGALPPPDTEYPFTYMGDCRQSDEANKSAVHGRVYLTIHVWHNNPKQRGTVSKMLLDVKTICRQIRHTANFAWDLRNIDQQIFADTTTKTPLLHGVIEAEFYFS